MVPPTQAGAPSPALTKAIDARFGSLDMFKAAFKKRGNQRFESGWVWLIVGADGEPTIASTPNQENPMMDAVEAKGTPILGNNVW